MANQELQKAGAKKRTAGPRCSFCNKDTEHAGVLIESPPFDRPIPAYICGQCVELCASLLDVHKPKPKPACGDEPDTEYFPDGADLGQ
jgi:hypothetical protein